MIVFFPMLFIDLLQDIEAKSRSKQPDPGGPPPRLVGAGGRIQ